jgi:hypothetical protein
MHSDSVIEDVWKAKDAIAASCDYNPEKLAEMLKASTLSRGLKTVDYHVRRGTPPNAQELPCVAEDSAEYKTKAEKSGQ